MEKVLGPLIGLGVLVNIDDVLIYAETPEQLIDIFTAVRKLLLKAGHKCNASKFSIFTQTIKYLCRVLSRDGINTRLNQARKNPTVAEIKEVHRIRLLSWFL